MIQAIVLAGGSTSDSLKAYTTVTSEALIEIGSKKMIEYVVEALQRSNRVSGIVVVGPRELKDYLPESAVLKEPGNSILDNVILGISNLPAETSKTLIVTVDIPFINEQIIDRFIEQCEEAKADVFYPIVSRESCEQKFPTVKRTYVKLKDGVYTGGNLFLLNPSVINTCQSELEQLIENRKKPLRMVKVLGLYFLFKLLLQRLSISDLEIKVNKLFNIRAVAIISNDPEIGVDVDKALDWELANKHLG